MKNAVLASVFGSALLAASLAQAVTVSIVPFTNNPASDYPGIGISPSTVYTHLLDFPADNNPDTINGVAFTAASQSGGNYSIAGTNSVSGNGSGDLLGDFYYGTTAEVGHVETDTFSGLSAGTTYDLRLYTGPFGSRPQTTVFTNGTDTDSRTYDPGNNTQYLSYLYTAQGASVTLTFTSQTDNNSFHQYAVSNQVVPEPASLGMFAIGGLTLFGRWRRA